MKFQLTKLKIEIFLVVLDDQWNNRKTDWSTQSYASG
jgi:hypothetical protein